MLIGLVVGMLAYRSSYAAVFNFRYNHIPLLPYAVKTQQWRYTKCHYETDVKIYGHQATEGDEAGFRDWRKMSEAKTEEREEGLAWLKSIKSMRRAGPELESETTPRMRKHNREAMMLTEQSGREEITNIYTTTAAQLQTGC